VQRYPLSDAAFSSNDDADPLCLTIKRCSPVTLVSNHY